MDEPIYIQSKITGGHFALKTKTGKKPFENPMDINTKIKLYKNDIVADIGGYIGEYSLWAIRSGVKEVLTYEPTPHTFDILKRNAKGNMKLFNMAVVGDTAKFVNLYISKGIGVTNSITKTRNKQSIIKVPAIKYEKAVANATVVKIDVEGAEYSYNIIQPQLRAILLEFHPLIDCPWREWAERIMDDIEHAGYTRIVRPHFKSGWSLTGCWEK